MRRIVPWALALALLAPSEGSAGTGQVVPLVGTDKANLVYRATPGETNRVTVTFETTTAGATAYRVRDRAGVRAGPGCIETSRVLLNCPLSDNQRPGAPRLDLGDRNDSATVLESLKEWARVHGGPGHDTIEARGVLHGGLGDDAIAGSGILLGGRGDDSLLSTGERTHVRPGPGRDEVSGGLGLVVRARDGAFDQLECSNAADVFFVDRFDMVIAGDGPCEVIRRRGAPRAGPFSAFIPFGGFLEVGIGCPADRRDGCRGSANVSEGGRLLDRERYRLAKGETLTLAFDLPLAAERRIRRRGALVTVITVDRRFGELVLANRLPVFVEAPGDE